MYKPTLYLLQLGFLATWVAIGALGLLTWPASLLPLALVAALRVKQGRLTTLGSARWAGRDDLERAGMIDADRGLILGHLLEPNPRGES